MNLIKVEELATGLMAEHLGDSWTFKFDNAKVRFGCTNFATNTISLSKELCELNGFGDVLDTIMHEIAHALCGRGVGHTKQWKMKAMQLGYNPSRCYDGSVIVAPQRMFTGHCPNCNRQVRRHRRNRIACGVCCTRFNGGRFSHIYLINWER